jgi:hypothetical protein
MLLFVILNVAFFEVMLSIIMLDVVMPFICFMYILEVIGQRYQTFLAITGIPQPNSKERLL